jgi:type II secretory pathway component GspD/PulD (secretin)
MKHLTEKGRKIFTGCVALALLCVSLCLPGSSTADEGDVTLAQLPAGMTRIATDEPVFPPGMNTTISLDLRNIEIVEALKFLAVKADLDIVATKNVAGRVTLMVDDVQIKDIFDIMIRSNSLAYTVTGSIYNIMTEDEYQNLFGKNFADLREVRIFRLQYAIPEQAFNLIDTVKSSIGRVLVDEDSGTVLVMDIPEKLGEIEYALSTLEEKNLIRVFDLQYAMAKDVEEKLKMQIDAKNVGITRADERSNQIIIQTFPERMEQMEDLISALDKKTKEVLIDVRIVKVKLKDQMDTGVEWEGLFNIAKKFGMTYIGAAPFSQLLNTDATAWQSRLDWLEGQDNEIGSYPFSGTSSTYAGSKTAPGEFHLGFIDRKRDVDILVKYLETLGNTQILSNPKLAVVNNQEARIHVGERQAYITSTTTTGQATSTVSEDVTFIDIGIKLSVTPTINDDGFVTMKIKPEVSSVVDTLVTPSGNKIPIIDTSTAETTVMIKDGKTLILGGLRKDEKKDDSEGIPYLSKIPILGFVFKKETALTERTELLVVITPYVVSGDRLVTGDERDFTMRSPGKEYGEYKPLTEESLFEPAEEAPAEKVRRYSEYGATGSRESRAMTRPVIEIRGKMRE